ncbi:MAG TPA: DegQ family serine endoprotease [Blastocatellia bacterium]|nr:DegQ family serine endoprotease [Blastocatellia bacterium]
MSKTGRFKTTLRRGALVWVTLAVLALLSLQSCRRDENGADVSLPPALPANGTGATGLPVISYADVVNRVAPAVVTIRSARVVRAPRQLPFFDDPFFRDFFGDRYRGGAPAPRQQIQRGLGSGVVITKDGYILTNFHVVDGAEEIKIEMADNRAYDAKLIGDDPRSDLAVLKINANDLPMLTLGDSDRVRVGDVALAVGNPLGIGQTVTAGIISAKGRTTGLSDGSFESFLQTDAPINQGNSGGALVATSGELIGINSQIVSPTGGNIGIGFAIPANMARSVAEQLIKTGKVRRGHLGVTIQPITSEMAANLGLKEARGVIVNNVEQGSPADRAGIKQGDVITVINGNQIEDANSLRNIIASAGPGAEVTIVVLRDGREQQVRAKLGELAAQTPGRPTGGLQPEGSSSDEERLGMVVTPMTAELAARLGLRRDAGGLVITDVSPSGPAADAGLQPGDVIEQVNRQAARSQEDLKSALSSAGSRPLLLFINRRGSGLYVTLRLRG